MKQVIQNYRNGKINVDEVAPPALRGGGVLVANRCSVISAGTERATLEVSRKSLIGKAQARPDLVQKVREMLRRDGLIKTLRFVRERLGNPTPMGYSSAGEVIAVAGDVGEFRPGDQVACAGVGYANHAEVVFVPKNLCVKIPEPVSFEEAAFATLGAVALQGVRRAEVSVGESAAVIGLGLLGQIVIQILRSAGCRVLGADPEGSRCQLARDLGADLATSPESFHQGVWDFTQGKGVDSVIITASTKESAPMHLAGEISRDRGRVVVVGDVKVDVPRDIYYAKELELRLSRSYGPGRYDQLYEEKGIDYPYGYVRWTEKRNMEAFLELLSIGKVKVEPLITHRFDISDADKAYEFITGGGRSCLGVVIQYPGGPERLVYKPKVEFREEIGTVPTGKEQLEVGIIGAGAFAQRVLIPHIVDIGIGIRAVATARGMTAQKVAKKLKCEYATSDSLDILKDERIKAVIIATRHDLHASLVIQSLKMGKHVFVEKPLCLTEEELKEIITVYTQINQILMVGFNRRFSPLVRELKGFFKDVSGPLSIICRVNAGPLPPDHWARDPREGGGRILGEVCHFVDLAQYIAGGKPERVYAETPGEGGEDETVEVSIRFRGGTVASISYITEGDPSFPKEYLEVYGKGSVAVIHDYKRIELIRGGKARRIKKRRQEKGHREELEAFFDAVREITPPPIPFEELISSTQATMAILESVATGNAVKID